ncbi:sodium/potassium/calcium exchanger 2-like isoform X3 [Carassius carassius]|uniref:sodium/potassium/calcium exchanger 2-like isoform X3 n=1 Tax=Carassius carassius TaxID=217509 RepID=UPI002868BD96|nr:sodium/potassium/calcium exchanger 2-like isoform X3 [Carassius carassius]
MASDIQRHLIVCVHKHSWKKLRPARVFGLLISLIAISAVAFSWSSTAQWEGLQSHAPHRTLLSTHLSYHTNLSEDTPIAMRSSAVSNESQGDYPTDLFSLEDRRHGAVILHMFGMIYMFIALAIVCDEFFVPALTVITEKLKISDDVAGATFMAAGGSAPELFTSVIGVFISHSNVGIGTIVGSAVFNILFVIGMCAVFSREILNLTWWPLFRDVFFYIVGLIMLIVFFLDNYIMYWESISLLLTYATYVLFMKFNGNVETFVKGIIHRNQVVEVEAPPKLTVKLSPTAVEDDSKLSAKPRLQRGGSSASLHNSLMRNSIFHLMIHTLDPLSEEFADSGKFREKASVLQNIAKKKCQVEDSNGVADKNLPNSSSVEVGITPPMNGTAGQDGDTGEEDDEEDQPLSLSWPETKRKRFTYLLILPIVLPLWITLPDVRKASSKKFFPITFLGAICWIAGYSYLMVWWAHQVGETIGITEEIMGLTILAAGTSIPDLITSVIVARRGLGDMAVSSSVGSNIFDITVGLPLPWLLYSIINGMSPVQVSSNGLFCAIVLLFIMLLFVIISIAACKWKMSKLLGFIMFLLYMVFLVVSVLLEDKVIVCPISV